MFFEGFYIAFRKDGAMYSYDSYYRSKISTSFYFYSTSSRMLNLIVFFEAFFFSFLLGLEPFKSIRENLNIESPDFLLVHF